MIYSILTNLFKAPRIVSTNSITYNIQCFVIYNTDS